MYDLSNNYVICTMPDLCCLSIVSMCAESRSCIRSVLYNVTLLLVVWTTPCERFRDWRRAFFESSSQPNVLDVALTGSHFFGLSRSTDKACTAIPRICSSISSIWVGSSQRFWVIEAATNNSFCLDFFFCESSAWLEFPVELSANCEPKIVPPRSHAYVFVVSIRDIGGRSNRTRKRKPIFSRGHRALRSMFGTESERIQRYARFCASALYWLRWTLLLDVWSAHVTVSKIWQSDRWFTRIPMFVPTPLALRHLNPFPPRRVWENMERQH